MPNLPTSWLIPKLLMRFLNRKALAVKRQALIAQTCQQYWKLVAFLDGLLPAFLGRLLPALGVGDLPKYIKGLTLTFHSTYVDAHFMRDRYTALLGHLMAGLVRNVLALGVRHSGADFVGCGPALGVRDLLAVLHRQLLAPL